jgi:hypothetical protein
MEGHVADIARNVAGKLYGRRELLRLFPRARALPLELSVALGHLRSITRLCVSRVIRLSGSAALRYAGREVFRDLAAGISCSD